MAMDFSHLSTVRAACYCVLGNKSLYTLNGDASKIPAIIDFLQTFSKFTIDAEGIMYPFDRTKIPTFFDSELIWHSFIPLRGAPFEDWLFTESFKSKLEVGV